MQVLAALAESHEVTLFTTVSPGIEALKKYYDVDIGDVDVVVPEPLEWVPESVRRERAGVLFYAVLARIVLADAHDYDLDVLVSSFNEVGTADVPVVQYVHCPLYRRSRHPVPLRPSGFVKRLYTDVCRRVAGVTEAAIGEATVLTNSDWTAKVMNSVHDVNARSVYPPVDVAVFSKDERETTTEVTQNIETIRDSVNDPRYGFISIGRQTPDKNLIRNVEIVSGVRECGHDVGLTIVGPPSDGEYAADVRKRTAECPFVTVTGEVSRPELVATLDRHDYGLHGKDHEHFGIAVAEMVAAGVLPFVPDNGGQREVVGEQNTLTYRSVTDAVKSIDRVLSNKSLERRLRQNLPDPEHAFGRGRFRKTVRTIVERAAARGTGSTEGTDSNPEESQDTAAGQRPKTETEAGVTR